MLRVWGGGIYESTEFYSICDELGILVWQDFMFACGQYPCHPEHRKSVQREVECQLVRLKWFGCIVLYAGNNEDYQLAEAEGLEWDPEDKDEEKWLRGTFPARYLYERLLPDMVKRVVPGVAYHPGSPWGGVGSNDTTVGDIHQWSGTKTLCCILSLPLSDPDLSISRHLISRSYSAQLYPSLDNTQLLLSPEY